MENTEHETQGFNDRMTVNSDIYKKSISYVHIKAQASRCNLLESMENMKKDTQGFSGRMTVHSDVNVHIKAHPDSKIGIPSLYLNSFASDSNTV